MIPPPTGLLLIPSDCSRPPPLCLSLHSHAGQAQEDSRVYFLGMSLGSSEAAVGLWILLGLGLLLLIVTLVMGARSLSGRSRSSKLNLEMEAK